MKANAKLNPKGKVEIGGLVDGKQMKGESLILNQETLEAATATAADALNKQNIPREYKKHAKDYFEQLGGTKSAP